MAFALADRRRGWDWEAKKARFSCTPRGRGAVRHPSSFGDLRQWRVLGEQLRRFQPDSLRHPRRNSAPGPQTAFTSRCDSDTLASGTLVGIHHLGRATHAPRATHRTARAVHSMPESGSGCHCTEVGRFTVHKNSVSASATVLHEIQEFGGGSMFSSPQSFPDCGPSPWL